MNKSLIISVIDDDEVYQFTTNRMIKKHDLAKKLLMFSDGEEALDFFIANIENTENLPDLVFLDVNMPIMDGWQFLEEYAKIKPGIKKKIAIYMVSSSVDVVDHERALKISELTDFIVKPIEQDILIEIINSLGKSYLS